MEFLNQIWNFVTTKPAAAGVILTAILAVFAGLWALYRHLSVKPPANKTGQSVRDGDENIQIRQARDVTISKGADVDVSAIVKQLAEEARQHGAAASQLEGATERKEELRDQVRQLTEAVQALADERGEPDAPPGIAEALELLAGGKTEAAEKVFEEVKERRKAEGEGALKEAAAAARHIGALAFLHDTDKALAAYREAVALDPDDPDGWNQLGHLLDRTGDLDGATEAYGRVLSLGNAVEDQGLVAAATGNLGLLYATRGDLDRAEEMHRKSLDINESLGRKAGMAIQYGNLGNRYLTRGDLDRAEEMYRKSLDIDESLGRKEGMADQYGNLGNLYATRGDLDRAEEMFRKSLDISESLGRKEGMASVTGNLGILYKSRGDLDRAEEMHRRSLNISESLGRKEGMAIQYGNLGNLYKTRGDLDRAEEMYQKSLDINELLGRKEGMAIQYGNFGNLYLIRGEPDQAEEKEEMHRKSLEMEIEETLGRKEGMANQYGNLGILYKNRGDLDRAEEMYRKSLDLFRQVGATPKVEHMERLLAELRDAE